MGVGTSHAAVTATRTRDPDADPLRGHQSDGGPQAAHQDRVADEGAQRDEDHPGRPQAQRRLGRPGPRCLARGLSSAPYFAAHVLLGQTGGELLAGRAEGAHDPDGQVVGLSTSGLEGGERDEGAVTSPRFRGNLRPGAGSREHPGRLLQPTAGDPHHPEVRAVGWCLDVVAHARR